MFQRVNGWRRFERGSRDGSSDRFWEVRVVDRDCEIRFGEIGSSEATEEQLEHASEADARRTAKQKIRTKQLAGWVEVERLDDTRARSLERGAALEHELASDPSNLDAWSVYADWLQQIEPVLGERLALGLALARAEAETKRAKIQARIDELERTHARELFGVTLAGVASERKFAKVIELERPLGMIESAKLTDLGNDVLKLDALLGALFELPMARLLLRLHVEMHAEQPGFAKVAETIVAHRHAALRHLTIGDGTPPPARDPLRAWPEPPRDPVALPELQALLDRCPQLERLELHGSFHGNVTHSSLRELKLRRSDRHFARALPHWRLPALETLHVTHAGRIDWSSVELPRLRRLLIEWEGHGDELVENLAEAALLDQLESLVLTRSNLSADGLRTILAHVERFAKLGRLVLLDVEQYTDVAPVQIALPNAIVRRDDFWERRGADAGREPWERRDALTRF